MYDNRWTMDTPSCKAWKTDPKKIFELMLIIFWDCLFYFLLHFFILQHGMGPPPFLAEMRQLPIHKEVL